MVTLEPPPGTEGPLSWHLTNDDKEQLREIWSLKKSPEIIAKVKAVKDYLDDKGSCGTGELAR